jgi:hypothetical protein
MELTEKIKRLEKVLDAIEGGKRYESSFTKLKSILLEEYRLEGGKDSPYVMGSYNHNLSQTLSKQAHIYEVILKKRPKKGAPNEYDDFISNFRQDVQDELSRCNMRVQ